MAFKLADRVWEKNAIRGTGAVRLGAAVPNFRTFASQMSDGDTTWYALVDNIANVWEVGVGTYTASGNTLGRVPLSSSNDDALVNFPGNVCDCFMDIPAAMVGRQASGVIGQLRDEAGNLLFDNAGNPIFGSP